MAGSTKSPLPPISHVLETCLYVRDLPASVKFYKEAFEHEPFLESPRLTGFSFGETTLLLFQLGATGEDMKPEKGGLIPGHGPTSSILEPLLSGNSATGDTMSERVCLKQHFCLAVRNREDALKWEEHFRNKGVKITGTMDWDRGGRSVYFEDPDGHVGEVGSRGIWQHY